MMSLNVVSTQWGKLWLAVADLFFFMRVLKYIQFLFCFVLFLFFSSYSRRFVLKYFMLREF